MKPFAKLFDTPHGQFLAFMDYDSGNDVDTIVLMGAAVNGIAPSARMNYPDDVRQQAAFDSIDQAKAEWTAENLFNAVKGLSNGA